MCHAVWFVDSYQRFGGVWCLHLQGTGMSTLKLVTFKKTAIIIAIAMRNSCRTQPTSLHCKNSDIKAFRTWYGDSITIIGTCMSFSFKKMEVYVYIYIYINQCIIYKVQWLIIYTHIYIYIETEISLLSFTNSFSKNVFLNKKLTFKVDSAAYSGSHGKYVSFNWSPVVAAHDRKWHGSGSYWL